MDELQARLAEAIEWNRDEQADFIRWQIQFVEMVTRHRLRREAAAKRRSNQ